LTELSLFFFVSRLCAKASMMATGAQTLSAAASRDPLNEAGILQRVLSYVPGQWLFLAAVSRLWKSGYARLPASEMQIAGIQARRFTCVPNMTLYSSVFLSPARVEHAHASGVDSSIASFQSTAGEYGTVAALWAARELGMRYSVITMKGAVKSNQLSIVKFLRAQGCQWNATVSSIAAQRGDLEMLRWLKEHGCPWKLYGILNDAVSSGNIELTAGVKQQPGVVCNEDTMNAAARKGLTAICEYLHAEQCPWSEMTCDSAAIFGHVHTVRWLHENGCPWSAAHVCTAAAVSSSVDVMEYLQQQGLLAGSEVLTSMLNAAGTRNKLVAAQWLRQQGTEWPAVLRYLMRAWSGDTLAWARAEGCTSPTQ
jgi:hypothetical protein